ncbi:MAG TPA: 1-acyl-sn-glycerol-3-phosphate acyltransferase [Fulvivirga sp.]|nr:1-acyl-sn-glycerol-3-phosphate acyltransferase [Fulvivirga sp.]
MANIFYWIYKSIRSNKFTSAILLSGVIGLSVFTSLQLKFEENIVAIMPQDADVEKIAAVFEGFDMNKRLVFHLYSDSENQADSLINVSQKFTEKLKAEAGQYIDEIKLEIPDDQILHLYNYYYNNLPFYLQPQDYEILSKRITENGAAQSVKQLYKSLISPMGLVTKTMQVKDPFGFTGFPLERTKELQLDDNFILYKNHIITKDKKHLMFFVKLHNPPNETARNGELIDVIDNLVEQMSTESKISIEYFGAAAVAVANANRIKDDILLTVSLAMASLFLFISLFYKKVSVFFLAVTPGVFGGLLAMAVLSIVKTKVSIISLAVGSVLLGITIDYALHFFTHSKKEKDTAKLFDDLTTPLLMSSITTACAFFSLMFIRSTALQDLGIFAGTSVIAAALYTLIVLPHFISKSDNEVTKSPNIVEKIVSGLASYPFYKKKWALLLVLLVSITSVFTWHHVSFESNMLELNYMPKKLANNEKNINAISNYSANNIYLTSTGKDIWEALAANEPLEQLLTQLQNDSIIFDHVSLNKIVPSTELQEQRLALWNGFWATHNKENVMQQLDKEAIATGFNTNTFAAFDSLLNRPYDNIGTEYLDELMSIIGEDLIIKNGDGSVSVLTIIKLSKDNKPQVLEDVEAVEGITILDRGHLTTKLVSLLNEDFNKLVNISLLIVFLIILISYGRIELTLITFIPILLSWLWVLGLMGLFDLKFNIVNIIVCTFIFGLGVDYSIFVMRGLTQQYKYGVDNLVSYKKSIILSVVTTLLGIGVLAFAQHPALKSIALLAIIGIASVIAITFTVEHLLYNLFIGGRKKKGVIPFTLASFFITVFAFSYFMFGCAVLQVSRLLFLIPIGSLKRRKNIYHWIMMMCNRSLVRVMANFEKKIIGRELLDFSKPSVIIANHHSFIDILIVLMFSPKVIMVTNDWVYYSPFFGKPVQFADFIPASKGIENQMDKIQNKIDQGFSIIVFPEGTRTGTFALRRFHKGAFYLADHFKLDVQPLLLHGSSLVMPKGDDFYLKNNLTTIKFLPRVKFDDPNFGEGYTQRAKKISKYFKEEHQNLRDEIETPGFFREIIIKNYLFKGPILEWYVKIKLRLEKNYELFHELIPKKAHVTDLGCGYGMMSLGLALSSSDRIIKGIDYDANKIEVAKNCPSVPPSLTFEKGDVAKIDYDPSDVFLICDVLHYFTPEEQQVVMGRIASKLNKNGIIIIRDGDSDKAGRHLGTRLTEFFSTNFGFNKTRNKLNYISGEIINDFAVKHNMEVKTIDNTKRTSNTVFVLRRK